MGHLLECSQERAVRLFGHKAEATGKYDSGSNAWGEFGHEELEALWRLRYIPEKGLAAFKGGEMWFVDHVSGVLEQGPSLHSQESTFWLISDADGEIYVGHGPEGKFDETYSPEDGTWTKVASSLNNEQVPFLSDGVKLQSDPRFLADVSLGQNRYLVHDPEYSDPWIYDLEVDTLTKIAEPSESRIGANLLRLTDGTVLKYGGRVQDGFTTRPATTYEVYNPDTDSWTNWEPASLIDDGWVMADAWNIRDDGTVLGSFVHESNPLFEHKLGVHKPGVNEWAWFPFPVDQQDGRRIIPLGHRRLMVVSEAGIADPEISAWIVKLP